MSDNQLVDMGMKVPFTALTLKPFAIPEKQSIGPLNHLIVEFGAGVCGASNGFALVRIGLSAMPLKADNIDNWPDDALTVDTAPPSLVVPWDVLERASHAALSMIVPPKAAYVVDRTGEDRRGAYALMVTPYTDGEDPDYYFDLPDIGAPEPFLMDESVANPVYYPDAVVRFDAKFLKGLVAMGSKMGLDEVTIHAYPDGGPVNIFGRENTGDRFFASMMPSLLTERIMRGDDEADPDTGEIIDAEPGDPRINRQVGSGIKELPEGNWKIVDSDDDDEYPEDGPDIDA